MRRFAIVILAAAACAAAAAQELRATTEDGRKVLLSPDGKWRFNSNHLAPTVSPDSASPYQPAVKKFSFSFNTNEWTIAPKRDGGEAGKRVFQHKSLPVFGMVISDEMPANNNAMRELIVSNARQTGAETLVLLDETQRVNGKEVGVIRFSANLKGVEFLFSTNYFADDDGNIQVACYTSQSLFSKYQRDCEKFLSGLTIK